MAGLTAKNEVGAANLSRASPRRNVSRNTGARDMADPTPAPMTDLAHDIFRSERQPLDPFFSPKNVAVIGATEAANSVGRTLLRNLINTPFGGTVWPVNPKRASVLGIKAYPNVKDIPAKIDLAVIVTPAPAVPGI